MFFNKEQKELARMRSNNDLKYLYKKSEEDLKKCAKVGDTYGMKENMKKHQLFEYALLYQDTPQFKKKEKKKKW